MDRRVATLFRHEQTEPSATWTIKHNLKDYPIVDTFIDIGGVVTKIIPASVTYVDIDTCVVSFSVPRTGFATVV